ncbi:hypothetical protein LTR78_009364 [Recurvomyces mirabilis]|uniref:Protein kinase domain-containing protein n=1 Tax=Recurvomyces mirabilis TaxID=574656 RepID=A0AAE0WHF6_9PEZI|nr:hypothetical protein LTR78_009364 [Recurvomyces mirabilis]
MLQDSPSDRPQIASKQDLTDLCEVEDVETGSVSHTTFSFVDTYNSAWFGQVSGVRMEDLRKNLRRISDEVIYPEMTAGLTIVADENNMKRYYIKRPKLLCLDDLEETKLLPRMLVEEAQVLEILKPYGHRNLVRYHGCISKQGRIAGIALQKYDIILQYRFDDDPRALDVTACMSGIRAGIEQLHSLGLAHNDLNPLNIAMDQDNQPVILDFESCRMFGEALLSRGTPSWIDEDYSTSARYHDESALRKLDRWLSKNQSERMSEAEQTG